MEELIEPVGRPIGIVDLGSYQILHFGDSYDLTGHGDFLMVPTPGHTIGHVFYLIRGTEQHYLLTGDAAYYKEQINTDKVGVITEDFDLTRDTYEIILKYGQEFPLEIMCSHDPGISI